MDLKKVGNIYKRKGQAGEVFDPKGIAPSLTPGKRGGRATMPIIVSGQANGINTVPKSTKRTLEKNLTHETLELFPREKSQTTTCSVLAGLASRLASLERGQDLRTLGELSFLRSLGFSETKDPDIFSLKTLKVYLVTRLAKLSRLYLGFSPTWGIDVNGRYLTASTSAFPRIGSGCSLSDILEEKIDKKYFLSATQTERIARIMKQRNV